MQTVKLGSTDLIVSRIGLGSTKFGRNEQVKYPKPFEIPSDKELLNLLSCAADLGINLIDTAPAYGSSEARIGALLSNRQNWIIATKVGEEFVNEQSIYNFTPEYAKMSIERSLKNLKTDHLDIVLVHSDGNDVYNIQNFGILDFLADQKNKGHIRAFGMSTKTIDGGLLALEKSDIVMVTFNPLYIEEKPVITYAHQHNKGILVKKALCSGHIQNMPGQDPIQSSLKFIFAEPGVHSIIIGTINCKNLTHNVSCLFSS